MCRFGHVCQLDIFIFAGNCLSISFSCHWIASMHVWFWCYLCTVCNDWVLVDARNTRKITWPNHENVNKMKKDSTIKSVTIQFTHVISQEFLSYFICLMCCLRTVYQLYVLSPFQLSTLLLLIRLWGDITYKVGQCTFSRRPSFFHNDSIWLNNGPKRRFIRLYIDQLFRDSLWWAHHNGSRNFYHQIYNFFMTLFEGFIMIFGFNSFQILCYKCRAYMFIREEPNTLSILFDIQF